MGSESKHTPGPWEVHDDHPERACIYIRQTEAPYWADIAALYHAPGEEDEKDITGIWRNDPVRVANARLIAAAPDLLEALERCEEYFDERADTDQPAACDGPIPNEEMCMQMMVRAALSKATGGKP